MAGLLQHVRRLLQQGVILGLCWLAIPLPGLAASEAKPAAEEKTPQVELFGSIEYRGSLTALKKWTDIIEESKTQTEHLASCDEQQASCTAIARSWQQMLGQAKLLDTRERLNWVNTFFNRWPYRLDQEVYGISDYWATPEEFMRYSGDCEDYSITKYFALRQLGLSDDELRIVVLRDNIRNIAHAVLAVYQDGDAFILDNLSSQVLSHRHYLHYSPYYSLNEHFRWAHGQLLRPTLKSKQQ